MFRARLACYRGRADRVRTLFFEKTQARELSVKRVTKLFLIGLALAAAAQPGLVVGCAACYGQDSGPMARGMNWGILSLLGIIVSVLAGVAGFFIYLANRSANLPAASVAEQQLAGTEAYNS